MRKSAVFFLAPLLACSLPALAQDATPTTTTTTSLSALQETVTPDASASLLSFETVQLTEDSLEGLNQTELALFGFADSNETESTTSRLVRRSGSCKVYPGDKFWPSTLVWKLFNIVLGGGLLDPKPAARVCWGSTYDATACDTLTANWTNSYSHLDDPIETFNPEYEGMTCQPPSYQYSYITNCTQGGYPVYVVRAKNVAQIQLAVNFARATGVRLVVKNTGHDFLGKSVGSGALSIWTHYLKETKYYSTYSDGAGYRGPAVKAGAGVQAFELYKFARDNGITLIGGEGQTVGVTGGYIAGGGHSPLSSIYGMAADQVLAFEIVTPDGRFRTASATQNSDLYWALRGGGGGTWGVVTSVTVKAYPKIPVTVTSFTFMTIGNITQDIFWAGVNAYIKRFPEYTAAGTYAYWFVYPNFATGVGNMFIMQPFFFPNMTTAQAQNLLSGLLNELAALGISVTPTYTTYDNFYDAWQGGFPLETIMNSKATTASRLVPASNWESEEKLNQTLSLYRAFAEEGKFIVSFHINPKLHSGNTANAVNPAWRTALAHSIFIKSWGDVSRAEAKAAWEDFSYIDMQRWRDLTPGSGAYLGEADRLEPNFQQAFFGTNYAKLLSIKKKYDPNDLFWVHTGVGSEGWKVTSVDGLSTENGRLCRTS